MARDIICFAIEHRPGQMHGNADALSRCSNPSNGQCEDVDNLVNLKCGPCKKMFSKNDRNDGE